MAWITATTLDGRNANLQTTQIAVVLDRVPGRPQDGSVITLASGGTLEVSESPAELLRLIDNEESPQSPSASPSLAW